MRKIAIRLDDDIREERRRSRIPLVFTGLFLLVGLGPLALEGAVMCVANWKEFMGISAEARTPTLDRVQETLEDMNESCRNYVNSWFRDLPWKPSIVLPIAGVVMSLAMLLLRR